MEATEAPGTESPHWVLLVDVGAEGNGFTVTVVGFEFIGHPADNTVAVYESV